MNTLVAFVVSFVSTVLSFVNWMKIQLAIGVVLYILISNFNVAKADPGLGACGQCTSNVMGLSGDWFIGMLILLYCIVVSIVLIIKDKKK